MKDGAKMKPHDLGFLLQGVETLDWRSVKYEHLDDILDKAKASAYCAIWSVVVNEIFRPVSPRHAKSMEAGRPEVMRRQVVAVSWGPRTGIHDSAVCSASALIQETWKKYWGRNAPRLDLLTTQELKVEDMRRREVMP